MFPMFPKATHNFPLLFLSVCNSVSKRIHSLVASAAVMKISTIVRFQHPHGAQGC